MGTPFASNGSPPHNGEDAYIVKQYIIQTLILDVLERDIERIGASNLKMADIYTQCLRQAQDNVSLDLYRLRKQFRNRGIKVYEEERLEHGIRVQYVCRGYQHSFYMLRGLIRAEVKNRMQAYLNIATSQASNPDTSMGSPLTRHQ
ncbi:hypothetical protein SAMN04488689_103361 [Paenibacillus sp. cl6col]|uniref:hypothetical protein n=1 Tax=Paenibacillus TaxID=44249 RepID=UPI000386B244|nr:MULTISPECIES: hypothetical protein [Paenibacillus]EPY10148.1 hypothetical protein PAAL66ix_23420 [Paenibacillus alvei A6-6i-x]SDF02097.1 hypothetical protein SAMN04488689_103361 [Paenibacillus sp. cl6col]